MSQTLPEQPAKMESGKTVRDHAHRKEAGVHLGLMKALDFLQNRAPESSYTFGAKSPYDQLKELYDDQSRWVDRLSYDLTVVLAVAATFTHIPKEHRPSPEQMRLYLEISGWQRSFSMSTEESWLFQGKSRIWVPSDSEHFAYERDVVALVHKCAEVLGKKPLHVLVEVLAVKPAPREEEAT